MAYTIEPLAKDGNGSFCSVTSRRTIGSSSYHSWRVTSCRYPIQHSGEWAYSYTQFHAELYCSSTADGGAVVAGLSAESLYTARASRGRTDGGRRTGDGID